MIDILDIIIIKEYAIIPITPPPPPLGPLTNLTLPPKNAPQIPPVPPIRQNPGILPHVCQHMRHIGHQITLSIVRGTY